LSLPDLSAAIAAFQNAIAAVPTLADASLTDLIAVKTAGGALNTAFAGAVYATDMLIVSDPLATSPLETGPATLLATLAALEQQTAILDASAYFGRATSNIINDAG
jgi:hypothetical protein